jgi:phosphopentomutase
MKRAIILILDSLGIGAAADAPQFGDAGSNTLGHIAMEAAAGRADKGRSGPLCLPNLSKMGLGHACQLSSGYFPQGMEQAAPIAAYGYARELSSGKDTLRSLGNRRSAGAVRLGVFHRQGQQFSSRLAG